MPAERDATTSIGKSFAPPAPIEKVVGPEFAEPVPAAPKDWTQQGPQSASGIAAGAKGERHVVNPAVQRIQKEAEDG